MKTARPKLLVANRSEIACRVFQACREMGLATVALQAPGDEEARHLTYADEILTVPSYLDSTAIVQAAVASKVAFVHPGYGFLSERPIFARALEKAGIAFLGPRAETMEALGEKIAAKELAESVGVPTLPWAKVRPGENLRDKAKQVGFPLLLKASAGGGGKGMRRVNAESELDEQAESASAEAKAAFGDGTLFLERLVENPRHIEVQVFGDGEGEAVHLFERECSLQRRHQKVWEEAPAPNLSAETREGLHRAALSLSRSVKYRSAGTLEFLVAPDGKFYFLEMNTRLQVEHPVSELVTGVDLVHAQIELAMNPKARALPVVGAPRGHAIEVRLYAEDPAQGYLPTPGKIERIKWPMGPGIRVDHGIEEGQTITTLFDSMLAKIIAWAPDRARAIARMRYALEETAVLGIGTNQTFLHALTQAKDVQDARVDTGWIERVFKFQPELSARDLELLASLQAQGALRAEGGAGTAAGSGAHLTNPSPWRSVR